MMRSALRLRAAFAALLLLLPASVFAAELGNERRVAVVAGNNFGAPGDAPLSFAQRDALRFAETLRELGGVRKSDLFLLLDEDADALEEAIRKAGERLRDTPGPSMLLFYYSGHANEEALHLGPTKMAWREVRERLENAAELRVALVDACQAGAMVAPKGFVVGPAQSADPKHRGTAIVVSAEASEVAQETSALGGSYFTHYLISGLRGAADENHDGRVTLAEAHAYTSRETTRATHAGAPAAQHPVYQFDLSGQGDLLLTDLREAEATLELAAELQGRVVITETDSSLAALQLHKTAGEPRRLALPRGRYTVHLRRPDALHVAEVTLVWGGEEALTRDDLTARSYQSVAVKGGTVEIYEHRISLGAALQSPIVDDMGLLGVARLAYGYRFAPFELGLRFLFTRQRFDAVDTTIDARIFGGGATFTWEYPMSLLDLRLGAAVELQRWRQDVRDEDRRHTTVLGFGPALGLRLPLWRRFFAEATLENLNYLLPLEGAGRSLRPTAALDLALGLHF